MSTAIHYLLETLSYLLNKNYEFVSSIATGTYAIVLVLNSIWRFIQQAVDQTYNVLTTLVLDTLAILIKCGKVLVWIIIQLTNFIHTLFSILESIVFLVVSGASWIWSCITFTVCSILDGLYIIFSLPHFLVSYIDDNVFWCYVNVSNALQSAGSVLISFIADLIYHILLIPYYTANSLFSIASASINLFCKLVEHVQVIADDFSTRLQLFTEASIHKLADVIGTVRHIYLSVAQDFIQGACATSLNWNIIAMASTDQVFFFNNQLLFADSASLKDLVYSLCMLPTQLAVILIRDVCAYHRYITHAIIYLLGTDTECVDEPLQVPLPHEQVSGVYCVVEEVVWILWLTVVDSYAELLTLCVLCIGGVVVIKQQSLIYQRVRHNIHLDREEAQLDQDNIEPILLDSSDSESDSEEPIVIELSRTRSQRPMRSRSSTPELTTPGSETRYIRRLKKTLDDEINNRVCTVCQVNCRNVLLLPCKHVCVCGECAQEILRRRPTSCPLCRTKINQVMDIYM